VLRLAHSRLLLFPLSCKFDDKLDVLVQPSVPLLFSVAGWVVRVAVPMGVAREADPVDGAFSLAGFDATPKVEGLDVGLAATAHTCFRPTRFHPRRIRHRINRLINRRINPPVAAFCLLTVGVELIRNSW